MMKKLFFILGIIILQISHAFADGTSFTVNAPGQVIRGQRFQIEYTVNNGNGRDFRAPEFSGCTVEYGPAYSQMSEYSMGGGQRTNTSRETYTYTLRADKEGTYQISPATIKVDGKQYTSRALTLKVLPPDKGSSSARSGNYDEDISSAGSNSDASNSLTFVRLNLSKTKVYEQEAIVATIKLYTRAAGLQLTNYTAPSFEGFVVQDITLPDNQSYDMENYEGLNYKTAVIRKCLLFPQRTGTININPGKFDFILQIPKQVNVRGFFGGIMNTTQEVKKTVSTAKASVSVMPLPSGKPASYMGAVGSFGMTATLSSNQVKANDAVTLKIQIKGIGNLKYIKNPEVEFPTDFETYDPKVDLNTKVVTSGVEGTKTIEYTTIPRFPGNFTIPGIEFSYFDLQSKTYKTIKTPPYNLKVEKGTSNGTASVANFSNREDLKLLNQDIHFIKTEKQSFQKEHSPLFSSPYYWFWYIIPALLFIIFVIVNRKQARENANITLMKTKKANKVATKRLKIAGKYLKEHNKELFYDEVLKAVWGYLSDKLTLSLSELTKDNVAAELNKYGVGQELTDHFMEILNTCEFARYAPAQTDDAMDNLYAMTVEAIGKMENTVKK